jgi:hypothetical protein
MLSFPEPDHDILFSKLSSIDDVVWTGPKPSNMNLAREAGIDAVEDMERIEEHLARARIQKTCLQI